MSKPFPPLDEFLDKEPFDPSNTYVLDDNELAELEDAGMTGILKGLCEVTNHAEIEVPYDLEPNEDGAWISEENLHLALRHGYELYRHRSSFYYRRSPLGVKQYLLKRPPKANRAYR